MENFNRKKNNNKLITSCQNYVKETKTKPDKYDNKRPIGGFSHCYKKRVKKLPARGKYIPKEVRNDPFADPPELTLHDLQSGFYNLINQGYIPKYLDITPVMNLNNPILSVKQIS